MKNDSRAHFQADYSQARALFLHRAGGAGAALTSLPLPGLAGPNGEELYIDIARLGDPRAKRVLMIISGMHGVEGFAGSALQCAWLASGYDLPADTAVILVHALNPWGMAWLRRVNENNVDLNRNFLLPGHAYRGAPCGYGPLNHFLNPARIPATEWFLGKVAWQVARNGFARLVGVIAGGQYDYPRGLFYGGEAPQSSHVLFRDWCLEQLRSCRRVWVMDVHTGLGGWGEQLVIPEVPLTPVLKHALAERDLNLAGQAEDERVQYKAKGGLGEYLAALLPQIELAYLTVEYGPAGKIQVFRGLRAENQGHHQSPDELRKTLLPVFYPASAKWRQQVLEQGSDLLDLLLSRLPKS